MPMSVLLCIPFRSEHLFGDTLIKNKLLGITYSFVLAEEAQGLVYSDAISDVTWVALNRMTMIRILL